VHCNLDSFIMTYWLVSVPEQGSLEDSWRGVQKATGDFSQNYRFDLPMSLRVGGLDKLMELSDDLARIDVHVEGVVNKIRRQAKDLTDDPLTVGNRPATSYVTNFSWDEARYPVRKPLQEIVQELTDAVSAVDDDLKVRMDFLHIIYSLQLLCPLAVKPSI
jgi:V-type H+-transporting ATPase subunit C